MLPTERAMSGIKGRRIPGRPGRFDPSEPLHMTTRRAAKTVPLDDSPSINGSVEGDDSQRDSLDEFRPITSQSNGSPPFIGDADMSDISPMYAALEKMPSNANFSGEHGGERSPPRLFSPVRRSASPSRKRKRSSQSPLEQLDDIIDAGFERQVDMPEFEPVADVAEDFDGADLSYPMESESSSQSDGQYPSQEVMVGPSTDATPAASGPASPMTSGSLSEERSLDKRGALTAALEVVQIAQEDGADEVEEMDEGEDGDEGDEGDDADDADDQLRSDDEGRPLGRRRFGGRRRVAHPDNRIEAAMRRQTKLKSAYRSIARAQKAVLAEIAQRTIDNLKTNAELHKEATEYMEVMTGLDAALETRLLHLKYQHVLNLEQLKQKHESEQHVIRDSHLRKREDLKQEQLSELEFKMLLTARAAQLDADAQYETEDEDDIIPKLKAVDYRWRKVGALESAYDSRSRLALERKQAASNLEQRFEMKRMLDTLGGDGKPSKSIGFTVMDSSRRAAANFKRESLMNTKVLAEAAAEQERRDTLPIIPVVKNEDALALQVLSNLAARPSIAGPTPRSSVSAKASQTPSKPSPPQLHLQVNHGASPIPIEMSPRTTRFFGGRFEASMAPPATPRQAEAPKMNSPSDAAKLDRPVTPLKHSAAAPRKEHMGHSFVYSSGASPQGTSRSPISRSPETSRKDGPNSVPIVRSTEVLQPERTVSSFVRSEPYANGIFSLPKLRTEIRPQSEQSSHVGPAQAPSPRSQVHPRQSPHLGQNHDQTIGHMRPRSFSQSGFPQNQSSPFSTQPQINSRPFNRVVNEQYTRPHEEVHGFDHQPRAANVSGHSQGNIGPPPSRHQRPAPARREAGFERAEEHDGRKKDESPHHQAQALIWQEQPGQLGANEYRWRESRKSIDEQSSRRPSATYEQALHSLTRDAPERNSARDYRRDEIQFIDTAVNHTAHDSHPEGNPAVDAAHRQKLKDSMPNKAERGGVPRRQWPKDIRKPSRTKGDASSAGSPAPAPSSFAGSPVEQSMPPRYPHPPMLASPLQHSPPPHFGRHPPPFSAQYSPAYGPSPQHAPPHFQSYEYGPPYQHRNSVPGAPPPQGWGPPPPQSGLYAVPHYPPPPPGVPPDQYHHFSPPPPPGYPPPGVPQTTHSTSGMYNGSFGGATLLPASTGPPGYAPPGFRPAQSMPAFAQQQHYDNVRQRRKAQNEAPPPFSKFQSWKPPAPK